MKKNWIRIVAVAIFICADIATFLFAQGKVKIVEKVVTIYKELDSKQEELQTGVNSPHEQVGLSKVKTKTPRSQDLDYNDTDYLPDTEYDITENEEIQDEATGNEVAVEDKTADDLTESEDTVQKAVGYFNPDRQNSFPDVPSFSGISDIQEDDIPVARDDYPNLADEGVPIPQLPLCDRDFELDVDVGGYEDILLPELPNIS